MKNKIKLTLILGIFLISFASASLGYDAESLGTYQTGTIINLKQTCENCTYINITTLSYPNSTSINTAELSMTNLTSTTGFNYSLNTTSPLGIYLIHFESDENGITTTAHAWFEITQTGYKQSSAEGIGSAVYLILIIFLTCMFLFVGFKLTESEKLWVFGIFLIVVAFMFLVYDAWLAYEYQLKYVGAAGSTAIPEVLFYLFLMTIGAGLLVSGVLLFKRIPELIKWIKVNFKGESDDGWDNDKF